MHLDWRWIWKSVGSQIFRILAADLNFTRTAERMHTVQSNVTARVHPQSVSSASASFIAATTSSCTQFS